MNNVYADQARLNPPHFKAGSNLLYTSLFLSSSLLLTACGGGGGSDTAPEPAPIPVINDDVEISSFDDPLISHQWYLRSINAVNNEDYVRDVAGQLITGDTVRVAVIDTGIETEHEDLVQNITENASYNFIDDNNDPNPDTVNGDHGTSVAGILAARGGNDVGMIGVAPSAEIRAFKILNSEGSTSILVSDQLAALGYDPDTNYPNLVTADLDIFNLSYGFPINYDPTPQPGGYDSYYDPLIQGLESGVQTLRSGSGALYIKAVGNEFESINSAINCSQANDNEVTCFNANFEADQTSPYLIPVAAYGTDETKAYFSNTGSAIWISAPGISIVATDQSGCSVGYSQIENGSRTDPTLTADDPDCNYISYFGGTSAGTPIVSGAIALLLEANPDLTWRDVKHILASTAKQVDSELADKFFQTVKIEQGWVTNSANYTFSNYYGFGAVDVKAAIDMATNDYTPLSNLQVAEQTGTVSNGGEIPDFSSVVLTGLTETLAVNESSNLTLESVRLTLSMTGQVSENNFDFSDYVITLISPNGTESIVMTPFTGFEKQSAVTDYPMITHAFYGEELNGNWQLKIQDVDSQSGLTGEGKLVDWSLTFYGHEAQ